MAKDWGRKRPNKRAGSRRRKKHRQRRHPERLDQKVLDAWVSGKRDERLRAKSLPPDPFSHLNNK